MKNVFKNLMRVALVLTAALAAGLILTAGIFISEDAELKNVDGPLIDLDVMVEDLAISDSEGDSEVTETKEDDSISEFVISIRETEIRFNGSVVSSSNFEGIFEAIHKSGIPVRLVDDYAEYHTYKKVLEYLKEKGIKPVEERH